MEDLRNLVYEWTANPWARAGLVVTVSILLARIVDWVLSGALRRLTRRTRTRIDDRVIAILHRPIFVTVVLVGLYMATEILALEDPYRYFTIGLLKTLGVVVWSVAVLRVTSALVEGLGAAADRAAWIEARTLPLIDNVAKVVVFGVAIYVLLVSWKLDVKPWLASAGIAGIAIGFAAKDTLANLFGGLFILADAPYKIGDFIVLDSGERGMVTAIGLRSTRLLTRDDVEVTLPNAVIANAKIVNESGGPYEKARIAVTIGVAYGSDVDHVRRVLLETAAAVEDVSRDPEPRVRFTEFGDSALIFRLLCWVEQPVYRGRVLDALNTAVYKRFNAEGIQIPFPQRDVWVRQPAGSLPG